MLAWESRTLPVATPHTGGRRSPSRLTSVYAGSRFQKDHAAHCSVFPACSESEGLTSFETPAPVSRLPTNTYQTLHGQVRAGVEQRANYHLLADAEHDFDGSHQRRTRVSASVSPHSQMDPSLLGKGPASSPKRAYWPSGHHLPRLYITPLPLMTGPDLFLTTSQIHQHSPSERGGGEGMERET